MALASHDRWHRNDGDCILAGPSAARLLLPVLVGVSFVIFFIAGLNRDGIDIVDRPYIGMQLLTPFSIIAFVLFLRSRRGSAPPQDRRSPNS